MSSLWIFANHPIDQFIVLTIDLQSLIVLVPTAAVEDRPFDNLADGAFLVSDLDSGSILCTEAAIGLANSFIRDVVVVIFSNYLPRSMGSWKQNAED